MTNDLVIIATKAIDSREARLAFPIIQKYNSLINRHNCCRNDKQNTLAFQNFLAYLNNLSAEKLDELKEILGIEVQNT